MNPNLRSQTESASFNAGYDLGVAHATQWRDWRDLRRVALFYFLTGFVAASIVWLAFFATL